MKVSVVIPVHNEEAYIESCINALLDQTRPADEIIVVDNNCTDATVDIASKYPQITIIHEPIQGITPARNAGYSAARGDIIARTDADCRPPRGWLRRIEQDFIREDIDAVTGPLRYYELSRKNVSQLFDSYATMMRRILEYPLLHGPSAAITRDIWNKVKKDVCLDDNEVHEDYDLSIHIHKAGGTIKYDPLLVMKTSGRRIMKDPLAFFVEYPMRAAKTIRKHYSVRSGINARLRQRLFEDQTF